MVYWSVLAGVVSALFLGVGQEHAVAPVERQSHVVLLGTGNPVPDPKKSGPAVAVVVGDSVYLVDFGPGVVRRCAEAYAKTGLGALSPRNLTVAFSTHLHSDHTAGYADLILTPWVMGRGRPLRVYGPPGIESMTEHLLKAYTQDIEMRVHGLERESRIGVQVEARTIEAGIIHRDEKVTVEAIAVEHGTWEHAFGFRFETPDRVIVISGDTGRSENLIARAKGCDVLVHEVYSEAMLARMSSSSQAYHGSFHTSGVELGKIAAEIKPGLLVLYHQLSWSPEEIIVEEVRRHYDGPLAYGEDLDVY